MSLIDNVRSFIENKPDISGFLADLQNKSIPLDERWNAFVLLVESGVHNSIAPYGDGFIDTFGPSVNLYDDLYMERHETKTYPRFLEYIGEAETIETTNEQIAEWKEKVLASGNSGFTYDW